jgi:hypothetical protein
MPYGMGAPFTPTPAEEGAAASLAGLTWRIPATGIFAAETWTCIDPQPEVAIMGGAPGESFDVDLRFVGVVEQKSYTGGSNDSLYWQVGGSPVADSYNVYALTISSPPQTFYINRGTSGLLVCFAIDYTQTVTINAGATVTLSCTTMDNREVRHTISVSGVSDPTQPYVGQWVRMTPTKVVKR